MAGQLSWLEHLVYVQKVLGSIPGLVTFLYFNKINEGGDEDEDEDKDEDEEPTYGSVNDKEDDYGYAWHQTVLSFLLNHKLQV